MKTLENQRFLIVGGSSGIGLATAEAAAAAGAAVTIAARDQSRLAEAQRLPVRRIGQAADVANAILFFATTPFATGTIVRVDGGGVIA